MIQHHSSTAQQRAQWVSILLAQQGTYGTVSELSQQAEVSRQTFYSWKAKGQRALQATFKRVHVIFLHGGGRERAEKEVEWGKPCEYVASKPKAGARPERCVKASSFCKDKEGNKEKAEKQ